MKQVNCSDWHRGWGLGGNHHIGKLSRDGDTYTWRGHCQGRHGQTWNKRSIITFVLDGDEVKVLTQKGCGLPDDRDVKAAIEALNAEPKKSYQTIGGEIKYY